MEMFLGTVGTGPTLFSEEDVFKSAAARLQSFSSSSRSPPIYVEGLASAALAWLESLQCPDKKMTLAPLVAQALAGRAFDTDSQALLIRSRVTSDR